MQHPTVIPPIEYRSPRSEHRLEAIALHSINAVFRFLPSSLSKGLALSLARCAKIILRNKTEESLKLIEQHLKCSPAKADLILTSSYRHFSLNWLAQVAPKKVFNLENIKLFGIEKIQIAHQQGRGTIIAAMHMGLWEAVPHILKNAEIPVAIVVAVQHNPICDKIFNDLRSADGYHYVLHNRLGVRHLLRYLKEGGTVVILSDVDIGLSGLAIPFLEAPASTPSWPAELALRTNAQMLLGYNLWSQSGLEGHLLDLPDPSKLKEKDNATEELCLAMNSAMSDVIRENPGQWFWMQRRWKTAIERLKR